MGGVFERSGRAGRHARQRRSPTSESNHLTIETDTDTLALPTVPDGYTVKFNGADYEQLIAADGTVNHPLVDKTVQVAYVVTDTATGNTKTTSDIPYVVKGTNSSRKATTPSRPSSPKSPKWHSTSAAKLAASAVTKVVYDDDSLKAVVDEFVADYKDFTGIKLTAKKGAAEAGAFNFVKTDSTAAIAQLGDEGYTMNIQADRVVAKSSSVTGNMYAMQTILQMTKQDASGFVIGSMRDYPRFTTRGLLLDVARKPVSLEMMREITRTMRYYKMNDFQAHLSDNYIFLENYGKRDNEDEAFKAYDAFRLESSLTNDKGESPTAEDYSISKKTFKQFIQDERALGMNRRAGDRRAAHALLTKIWPELMVQGTGLPDPNSTDRSSTTSTCPSPRPSPRSRRSSTTTPRATTRRSTATRPCTSVPTSSSTTTRHTVSSSTRSSPTSRTRTPCACGAA